MAKKKKVPVDLKVGWIEYEVQLFYKSGKKQQGIRLLPPSRLDALDIIHQTLVSLKIRDEISGFVIHPKKMKSGSDGQI